MKPKIFFVILLVFIAAQTAQAQYGGWVTSQALIKNAAELDGEAVVFMGEVIGDLMPRGNFAWINIQDDYGTIGVWASLELTKEISYFGDYNHKGDIVAVEGTFFRADPELAGEFCIRAQNIRIVFPGFFIFHQVNSLKIKIVIVLSVLMILLGGLKLFIFKTEKNIPSRKL